MRILVACEFTGRVREAFRKRGHYAISADYEETEIPGNHYKGNVLDILYEDWDIIIGHPPCTRLANSVWWYINKNKLHHEVKQASEFFNVLLNSKAKKICIENPIQNKGAKKYIPQQTQIIQPYQFGENASKSTCLWLRGLPLLIPTKYFPPRIVNDKKRWGNQTDGGWNKLAPGPNRAKERSRTYQGIAEAFAMQWG